MQENELMRTLSMAVGGFLAAVLWFDLMFDVQVLGQPDGPLKEAVLDSIAGYYRRVLIDASPMGRLVGSMMLVGWASVGFQLKRRELEGVVGWFTAGLLLAPTLLAGVRIVPNALQLAMRSDSLEIQSQLARQICWDHIWCLISIAGFLGLQLWTARPNGWAKGPPSF